MNLNKNELAALDRVEYEFKNWFPSSTQHHSELEADIDTLCTLVRRLASAPSGEVVAWRFRQRVQRRNLTLGEWGPWVHVAEGYSTLRQVREKIVQRPDLWQLEPLYLHPPLAAPSAESGDAVKLAMDFVDKQYGVCPAAMDVAALERVEAGLDAVTASVPGDIAVYFTGDDIRILVRLARRGLK